MVKRITRVSPWQTAKTLAVFYFIVGAILAVPIFLVRSLAPISSGTHPFPPGFAIAFPFLYALAALVFVPIGCALYNFAARLVGGIEFSVADTTDG